MVLLPLPLLLSCLRVPPPPADTPTDTSSGSGSEDSGGEDSGGEDSGDDALTLERGALEDGRAWAVTLLGGDAPWPVAITSPAAAGDAPVPVALTMYGGLSGDPGCLTEGPDAQMLTDIGAVEVRVLGGAQCCAGICGEGDDDDGGPARQRALGEAAAFARGELRTVDGLSLSEVTGLPIDGGAQVMLLSSAVGHVGLSAIAAAPDAFSSLKGIALYEIPIHTEGLTRYVGMMPWDGDPVRDSRRSGCGWDDGGNPWIEEGTCAGGRCAIPRRLAWSDTAAVSDLIVYAHQPHSGETPGMLFIDGDGDGALTLSGDGHPDSSGDGLISRSEDMPLPGMPDEQADSERYWLSLSVMEEALASGVLTAERWPAHLHTLDEARAYWGARDGYGALAPITAARPELRWLVAAADRDHGIPQCGRPHIVDLYERLRDLGAVVQLNPGASALEAAGSDTTNYTPLPAGAALTEASVQQHTTPPTTQPHLVRTAAMLELIEGLR